MFNRLCAALGKILSGGVLFSPEDRPVWLIVGLGNPDREYAGNRHNIGFMVLDRLACDARLLDWRARFSGLVSEGMLGGEKVFLLKPQTYMNLSGRSVRDAARFYKIPPERILVFHDELDLPPGKLRVKTGGGAAGHNGLKSIDAECGFQDYRRVRIGIGHPGDKARVSGYVLSDFSAEERPVMDDLCAAVSDHIGLLLSGREADFMTKISQEVKG